jgi:hypothetical protein
MKQTRREIKLRMMGYQRDQHLMLLSSAVLKLDLFVGILVRWAYGSPLLALYLRSGYIIKYTFFEFYKIGYPS